MTEHPQAVVDTRRRAAAWKLVGASNTLSNVASTDLEQALEDDLKFLSEKELKAIEAVRNTLAKCEANLRKLAARMGVES